MAGALLEEDWGFPRRTLPFDYDAAPQGVYAIQGDNRPPDKSWIVIALVAVIVLLLVFN